MLKNYIITAINNLLKNKLYSAINIIGLAVGLAAFLLITLFVHNEFSYDKHWEKADLIYRVNRVKFENGSPDKMFSSISSLALPALKKDFHKDIEFGTRVKTTSGEIYIDNESYPGSVADVDKDFINIFHFDELKGSLKSTLQTPGNIALSEESANQYFGDKNPIGEIITFKKSKGHTQFKVSAVYRVDSSKTVLNIKNFTLLDESKISPSWNALGYETYIRFTETTDIKKFVARLPNFVDENIPANTGAIQPSQKLSDKRRFSIQNISDLYLNPINTGAFNSQIKAGNKSVITVYIIISVIILIIGSINFIILTTAKATQRSREVAMRKVAGARFKLLFIQFLGESVLLTFIAFLIAVAITEMALPFLGSLMNMELTIPYSSPSFYIFALLSVVLVGSLGGLYPSLVLSRFSPIRALKANQTTESTGSFKLRNALVVFQFTASIVLIIATGVSYFQLLYMNSRDLGFNPDNLFVVENIITKDQRNHGKTLQQELIKLPEVINIGLSSIQPMELSGGWIWGNSYYLKTANSKPGQDVGFKNMFVGFHFFETSEISLLSGRYFTLGMDKEVSFLPDGDGQLIINYAAARQLGYASADEAVGNILVLGKPDTPDYWEYTIIGVVEDSQYRSLRMKPGPEAYHISPSYTQFLIVKYQGDYQTVVNEVKRIYHSVVGDFPFKVRNVKQSLAVVFAQEEQENKVLIAFAVLSVFIACMGLYGMASFTVDRRVKEIGLRKVMGAKVRDITKLLVWKFLKPVLLANIIAWPVSILIMQYWAERFPYSLKPIFMALICIGSGLITLIVAWFTVAGNTKRVAKSKPIKALRYE